VREIIARHNELIKTARAVDVPGAESMQPIRYRATRHEAEERLNRVKAALAPYAQRVGKDLTKIEVHAPRHRARAATAPVPPAPATPSAVTAPASAAASVARTPAVAHAPTATELNAVGVHADGMAVGYLTRNWDKLGKPNAKQLALMFSGGIDKTVTDRNHDVLPVKVTTRLNGTYDGLGIGTYINRKNNDVLMGEYRWNVDGRTGHFGWIQLAPNLQGLSYAKYYASAAFSICKAAGANHIDLMAALDGGGYAWAKFGFVPDQSAWSDLKHTLNVRMGRLPSMPDDERTMLNGLIEYGTPKSVWAISDTKYGKQLLRGASWTGDFQFGDRQSLQRFQAYITKAPKKAA